MDKTLMEKIVALCKRRGFIYPGSEVYGGLGGTWDYGPLGVELKNNIKRQWWKDMVQLREDVVGVDTAIMMNPKAWEASGHVEAFTDPLVECKICHERFRQDAAEDIRLHEHAHAEKDEKVEWTHPQKFNLLVKAYLGVVEGKQSEIYLRGEITQGVHVNFKNVLDSTRVKIPFGIAQIGKAFRNEITPGNFTFRSREFEQMEVQYYVDPKEKEGKKLFDYWKNMRMDWYLSLGIKKEHLRFRDHKDDERAHYARAATDIEYQAPFSAPKGRDLARLAERERGWASGGGWSELEGIHHRGDWDLSRHEQYSGQSMKYRDPDTGDEYLPWVIETSGGVDRAALFFLIDAYVEDGNPSTSSGRGRIFLKLHPKLAPFKVAVFPLLSNKPDLVKLAKKIYIDLKENFMVAFDDRGNIGGRYAAQDEAGTPFCITVDFQSLKDQDVTVRDRDTTKQERVKIVDLKTYLSDKIR